MWRARRSCSVLVAFAATLAMGCGARTSLDTVAAVDAGLPAPPPTCAAAVAATDWSACQSLPIPDVRASTTIVCAHETATPGCEAVTEAYWSCIAAAHAPCVPHDAGVPGSIATSIVAPACDDALRKEADCLASCGADYTCADGWTDCRCSDPAPQPGAACGVYPAQGALPDCDVLCSACP